jgi:hypothetical protein
MPRSKTDFTNFIDTRPNYFPGQYLLEDDFEVQHQYLSDRQLYHHKSLHVAGILEGLDVEVAQGQKAVSIKSGSAIDGNGNLIIFKKDTVFSSFSNVTTGELYIQYTQVQQLKQQNEIPDSFTRWQEVPLVQFAAKAPDNAVKLASIAITNDVITLNLTVRVYSGVFLPNPAGNDLTLRSGGNANANLAVLNGSLSVTGDLAVTGTITGKIDTANITSGILSSDRIPNLSADKITTGTLNASRIPNLSADKITSGTVTGNLTIGSGNLTVSGSASIGATTIGSQINIDLSGHVQLKEYGTGSLAYLQARDDTSNRDIGLRLRTQTKSTGTKPTLVEALTIAPNGNVGVGIADPSTYKLNIQGDQLLSGNLSFGSTVRQMINLWSTSYGIGIQDSTQYFRTDANFAWYKGGSHDTNALNAGKDGITLMSLDKSGSLTVTGAITPSVGNDATKGIMFPTNPGGGGGDAAWIRYYIREANTEKCTLEIGIANDADDILYLNSLAIQSRVSISVSSSRELKENILDLSDEEALETIKNLRPVKYNYKAQKGVRANIGFIAEEMPENLASKDRKTISPTEIIPFLTKTIQNQQMAIRSLQEDLSLLKKSVNQV